MTKKSNPGGKGTVTPCVAVRGVAAWLEFVEQTFGTEKAFQVPNEDGTIGHAEITVGDSVLMAFDARPDWPDTPSFLSLFVDDVDKVLARALEAGATVVTELTTSGIVGDPRLPDQGPAGQHLVAPDPLVRRRPGHAARVVRRSRRGGRDAGAARVLRRRDAQPLVRFQERGVVRLTMAGLVQSLEMIVAPRAASWLSLSVACWTVGLWPSIAGATFWASAITTR